MSERCPLLDNSKDFRPGYPVDIPEVCLRQCRELMDEASETQAGAWSDYLHGEMIPDGDVGFSHDAVALDSLRNKSARQYRVVDKVDTERDWIEIGESTYTFNCPHT